MFAAERTKKIKQILLEYKHVDVNTLCSLLDCSVATVRRDLDKLESEGFLTKAYGGALLNEDTLAQVHIQNDPDPYLCSKKEIAQTAASLIEQDDIIYLGSGSTCLELASSLDPRQSLTIVTNNVRATEILSTRRDSNIILLGGALKGNPDTPTYTIGPTTLAEISNLYIKKAFFSVSGISLDFGYTVNDSAHLELLRAVIKQAEQTFVVADASKFDQRSMLKLADLTDLSQIITNVEIHEKYKKYFFTHKIAIYTSFDEK